MVSGKYAVDMSLLGRRSISVDSCRYAVEDIQVGDLPDDPSNEEKVNIIQIRAPGKSFNVYCETPAEKNKWLTAVRIPMEDLLCSGVLLVTHLPCLQMEGY